MSYLPKKRIRLNFIDFLRGVGIILVVLGHSIQFGSGAAYSNDGLFFENIIFRIIYSFHMPFFLLISGYLASGSIRRRSFPGLVKSRLNSLLIPIISWGIVQYLIQCALHHTPLTPHSILSCGRFCLENNWFLWAAFLCTLLVGFIHDFLGDSIPADIAYAAILILSFVTPDNSRVALYKFVFPFFLAAFLLAEKASSQNETQNENRNETFPPLTSGSGNSSQSGTADNRSADNRSADNRLADNRLADNRPADNRLADHRLHVLPMADSIEKTQNGKAPLRVWIITILLYLVLLHFFHTDSYIYISRFSVLGKSSASEAWKQVGIDLYRAALGFVGSFLCLLICTKFYRIRLSPAGKPAGDAIARFGRNSLGIYLISGILFEDVIAKLWVNHSHNIFLNLLETIAVLAVSDFLTEMMAKSKILSRIFLGGRRRVQ